MYGTVARMRVKPGKHAELMALSEEYTSELLPSMVAEYVYQMDGDPNEYYMAVVFESREAYVANAQSPEQHARYERFVALLDGDPEWHDGEIIFSWARPS